MLHRPGWLLRYILGPYNREWAESLYWDFVSGITVGLILIPQGLSYSVLAGLPAINGLYAAIIPSFTYVVLGSSMQLAVGPVAVVSLLTGQIVTKYAPDLNTSTTEGVEEALDITAQACVCVGIILTVMGILNLGKLIHLVSHPVMSAFTTAAAFTIGLSQLSDAVGFQTSSNVPVSFRKVPKLAQPGYDYNYEVMKWYTEVWYEKLNKDDICSSYASLDKTSTTYETLCAAAIAKNGYRIGWSRFNPNAQKIFAGIYVPLMIFQLIKDKLKETPERKKAMWFNAFKFLTPLLSFVAIIVSANCTYKMMQDSSLYPSSTHDKIEADYFRRNVNIVKSVVSKGGLHFGRIPTMRFPFGQFFVDVLPLTFVLFMESYSVARRIAAQRNQLHILDASQEMFANGIANFLGSVASAYPVAGSFSRSSLIANLGARSPLAKFVCMCVVLIAIAALSETFYYIPKAALSAVIFVAIYGLISITDFWEAWKHSKKDFLVMIITFIFVFVYETGEGLAIGIGSSLAVYLFEIIYSPMRAPRLVSAQNDNNGIDVIKIDTELTFITVDRLKDFVGGLTKKASVPPPETAIYQDKLFYKITNTLDRTITLHYKPGLPQLPKAIVLDLSGVPFADLTAIQGLHELRMELQIKGVGFVTMNANEHISRQLKKFGVVNSKSTPDVNLDHYLQYATNIDDIDIELVKVKDAEVEHVIIAKEV